MRHQVRLSFLAFLALATVAPVGVARDGSTASILFMRTSHHADSSVNTMLYRVKPSGAAVRPLIPEADDVDYSGGSWSPSGSSVAYERSPQWTALQSQLYVVDRQDGPAHQITQGPGLHTQASWGPGGTIAFFTYDTGQWCLGAVRADGTQQRILFCPPLIDASQANPVRSTPQWAPGGKSVYIEIGGYDPDSSALWHSRVYRVNVFSGATALRTDQVFSHPDVNGYFQPLAIAPDGKHGVYPGNPLKLFDFANGSRKRLSIGGEQPLYSDDGCKIAFIRSSPLPNGILVMNADGSDLHSALSHQDPDVFYTSIAGWSANGRRLLVNATAGEDRLLQIIDLETGTVTTIAHGTAAKGAWYHR